MPATFYLDADISQKVAQIVRRLDPRIDITCALELRHSEVPDPTELALATAQERCIVTRNYRDFRNLTTERLTAGMEHAGVLLVPSSLPNNDYAGIARAIIQFAGDYPHGPPPNFVGYLKRVR